MTRPPNIVYVLTDDQGYPPLGCHGHPYIQTPHLDAFHGGAARFQQFHVGSTCAPTRAGILTGHHCNATGVWHTIGGRSLLRKNEWTLAAALGGAGYRTGLFGKWHLGDDYPYRPQDRGFQEVVCHGGGGITQQPDHWGNDYFDDTYLVNGQPRAFQGYCTDVFFGEALSFIEAHRDEPFFCFIAPNAPHSPFNVEPRYRDLYTDHTDSENYARFLGMITNIDENFGRLRAKLRELDLEDNTILIFMSDNGQTGIRGAPPDMYRAGMRGLKGSPYEGGHRVPFLIRWPDGNIRSGRDIPQLTSYVDFMPTLLDLCGVEIPEDRTFHGQSLRSLLEGQSSPHWDERALTVDTQRIPRPLKWRMSCVMRGPWRLVNKTELYNIATDPEQTTDVAAQHPDLVSSLQKEYEEYWLICSAQMDEDIPHSIGGPGQDPAILRTHDLRNEEDGAVVWNQGQVRRGIPCHGYWEIHVEQPGEYEFELRRWPEETGFGVRDGIDGIDVPFHAEGIAPGSEASHTGGEALTIDTATLEISGLPQISIDVAPHDRAAVIRTTLPAGPRHLRARFHAAGSTFHTSAYYVYVRRLTA